MSKKMDVGAIANELSGSAFFTQPATPPPVTPRPKETVTKKPAVKAIKPLQTTVKSETNPNQEGIVPNGSTFARSPVRTTVRPNGRRILTRYSFEFFQDQTEVLKRWSLEQQLRGEKGSMSEMVREALDAYISRKLNSETEDSETGTNDRTSVRTTERPNGGGEQ